MPTASWASWASTENRGLLCKDLATLRSYLEGLADHDAGSTCSPRQLDAATKAETGAKIYEHMRSSHGSTYGFSISLRCKDVSGAPDLVSALNQQPVFEALYLQQPVFEALSLQQPVSEAMKTDHVVSLSETACTNWHCRIHQGTATLAVIPWNGKRSLYISYCNLMASCN